MFACFYFILYYIFFLYCLFFTYCLVQLWDLTIQAFDNLHNTQQYYFIAVYNACQYKTYRKSVRPKAWPFLLFNHLDAIVATDHSIWGFKCLGSKLLAKLTSELQKIAYSVCSERPLWKLEYFKIYFLTWISHRLVFRLDSF